MYEFLDTNVPIPVMHFKDFCKRKEATFFTLKEFRTYLSEYVGKFELLRHIEFGVFVKEVRRATEQEQKDGKRLLRLT